MESGSITLSKLAVQQQPRGATAVGCLPGSVQPASLLCVRDDCDSRTKRTTWGLHSCYCNALYVNRGLGHVRPCGRCGNNIRNTSTMKIRKQSRNRKTSSIKMQMREREMDNFHTNADILQSFSQHQRSETFLAERAIQSV